MAFLTTELGLVVVVTLAFFAGLFVWNVVQGYLRDMSAPNQTVIFKHPTDVVPADVMSKADLAHRKLRLWYIVAGLLGYLGLKRYAPAAAETIEDMVKQIVQLTLTVLIDILEGIERLLSAGA